MFLFFEIILKKNAICCTTCLINTYICTVLRQEDIIDRLN